MRIAISKPLRRWWRRTEYVNARSPDPRWTSWYEEPKRGPWIRGILGWPSVGAGWEPGWEHVLLTRTALCEHRIELPRATAGPEPTQLWERQWGTENSR